MPDFFPGWLGIRDAIEALYCSLAVGMLVTTLWALSHGHIPPLLSHRVGYGVFAMLMEWLHFYGSEHCQLGV